MLSLFEIEESSFCNKAQSNNTTMGKKKQSTTKSVNTNVPKTNELGEIVSWDSNSEDGKALKTLFDGGLITTETAKMVKKEYPRFRKYATTTLNSALANSRKRLEAEADDQVKKGSSGESVVVLLVSVSVELHRVADSLLSSSPQS